MSQAVVMSRLMTSYHLSVINLIISADIKPNTNYGIQDVTVIEYLTEVR